MTASFMPSDRQMLYLCVAQIAGPIEPNLLHSLDNETFSPMKAD